MTETERFLKMQKIAVNGDSYLIFDWLEAMIDDLT
jgi:hypothetical protein